jgi:hypothetical protein
MTVAELETIWSEFAAFAPTIMIKSSIISVFLDKRTYRFDVWYWFDETFPNEITEWVNKKYENRIIIMTKINIVCI